jgi:uncharacterized membrane protein YqjE
MDTRTPRHREPVQDERSAAQLVKQLSEQTSRLVRDEIRLAQLELRAKGKHGGVGVGIFGGAGLVAVYGVWAVLTALVLLLATVIEPWLAALIVGVVLLLVAGVLALLGRKQVRAATPPTPEEAMHNVKRDIDVVKEKARR